MSDMLAEVVKATRGDSFKSSSFFKMAIDSFLLKGGILMSSATGFGNLSLSLDSFIKVNAFWPLNDSRKLPSLFLKIGASFKKGCHPYPHQPTISQASFIGSLFDSTIMSYFVKDIALLPLYFHRIFTGQDIGGAVEVERIYIFSSYK